MAFHNINWTALPMTAATYTLNDLGNGHTGSTVHQLFCISAGTATITAFGGGTFAWPATAGQSIDVVVSKVIISSGAFVGFKTCFQPNFNQQVRIQ